MITDRELLELAAKAAGYTTNHPWNAERLTINPPVDALVVQDANGLVHTAWNPLRSALDAHDLACKFGMVVDCEKMTAGKPGGKKYMWLDESMSNVELVCRSITMAAAEIWKAKK